MSYPEFYNYNFKDKGTNTLKELKTYNSLEAYNQLVYGWMKNVGYICSTGHVKGLLHADCF